jgi:LmbE family N-acetylglucosaminyl deacetylase
MNYRRILVFGAHPDDELSMANAMAKFASLGVEVYVCTPTDGSEGYPLPEMKGSIVASRLAEAEACDKVIGATKRFMLGIPDMGLANTKGHLLEFVQVIREVRPDVIFTHGPDDNHRDHVATHELSVEAAWHAGEPVAAEYGAPWSTPYVLYYKGVAGTLPRIVWDTTGFTHIRSEALATQVSQHTLFRRTADEFLAEAKQLREANTPSSHTFYIPERVVLSDLPDLP